MFFTQIFLCCSTESSYSNSSFTYDMCVHTVLLSLGTLHLKLWAKEYLWYTRKEVTRIKITMVHVCSYGHWNMSVAEGIVLRNTMPCLWESISEQSGVHWLVQTGWKQSQGILLSLSPQYWDYKFVSPVSVLYLGVSTDLIHARQGIHHLNILSALG
jgi:hypothetical protein